MKKLIFCYTVFYGTLVLTHLFFIWACWAIGIQPHPVIFAADLLIAIGAITLTIFNLEEIL